MKNSSFFHGWMVACLLASLLCLIQNIRDNVPYKPVWAVIGVIAFIAAFVLDAMAKKQKDKEESRTVRIDGKEYTVRQLKKMIDSPEEYRFEQWLNKVNR